MNRLQQLRLDARLSIADLGAKSGVSPEQIGRIENGTTASPRTPTLVALADALDARPSELLWPALPPRHAEEAAA